MELESITVSEVNQTEKEKDYTVTLISKSYYKKPKSKALIDSDNRIWLTEGKEVGEDKEGKGSNTVTEGDKPLAVSTQWNM